MPLHPILPERRALDSRRTPPAVPQTPRRNPHRHGGALVQQLAAVQQPRRISIGIDPDLVFKMRAQGGRLNGEMLANRGVTPLADTADYTYFVLSRDQGQQLAQALAVYAGGPDQDGASAPLGSLFNWLRAIEPYGPVDRRGPGLNDLDPYAVRVVVDVSIWASDTYREAERRAGIVSRVVTAAQGEVLRSAIGIRRTVLRVAVSPPGLEDLLETSVVERVRTPPVPYLDPSDWRDVDVADLTLDRQPSAPVGVLDDAPATGHPLLEDLVPSVTEIGPQGYVWPAQGHHGTQVVGRVLFPQLHEQLRDHTPITAVGEVHVARILEPALHGSQETRFGGGDAGELPHVVVERAIRMLHETHQVRVFNLSIGMKEPFDAVHVSELTEVLDELARELDIVIVVPTGNAPVYRDAELTAGHHAKDDYPHYLSDPSHRLAEPGPAALALTVGAIAHSDAPAEHNPPRLGNEAIAGVGELAPFSRTGPGVGTHIGRINKPDLVHDGGNWVLDDTNQVVLEDAGVAVISTALDPFGRLFRACCGTSFAVPAVARCAADVLHAYPRASANLIRVLVVSSAEEPLGASRFEDKDPTRRRFYGAGRPDRTRAISSGARRVTMTYDGVMDVDTVAIHPVPIPEAFAAGRSSTRRIQVALAFDPPVRRQRREYLAGTMQIDLYRAVDLDELADIVIKQDPDDPAPVIKDRRRVSNLNPGVDSVRHGTLHVRTWAPKQLNIDDSDTYYLVVTHKANGWARTSEYARQRYALAVTLQDEARVNLDLYALVTQRVRVPARARIRS